MDIDEKTRMRDGYLDSLRSLDKAPAELLAPLGELARCIYCYEFRMLSEGMPESLGFRVTRVLMPDHLFPFEHRLTVEGLPGDIGDSDYCSLLLQAETLGGRLGRIIADQWGVVSNDAFVKLSGKLGSDVKKDDTAARAKRLVRLLDVHWPVWRQTLELMEELFVKSEMPGYKLHFLKTACKELDRCLEAERLSFVEFKHFVPCNYGVPDPAVLEGILRLLSERYPLPDR